MKLTMLGTGNALVTECYNTCFILNESNNYFMVDGGGGSTVLRQLKYSGIDWKDIKNIFVTHKHVDHLMGIIWMVRMICQYMNQNEYEGNVNIYAHEELIEIIKDIAKRLLQEKETRFIGQRLHLIPVSDGEECTIIGHKVAFFDIHSSKAKQYGFTMYLKNDEKLTCCGDEPYNYYNKDYVQGSKWLLHEAFCLHSQADIFKPYEKHHSTVKDACQLAEQLNVENLLLYHTEDKNITNRKKLYTKEGSEYFSGNLYIPDDLENIDI
ncbi:MBL fold metallo-hydrolase [Clostridium tyrobutyricum]|uniref:Ribonuclease Z n=1 Tax=Clostridium tyrobutyricum DIVETGP TaxID=1408889 RepID=W6N6W0_CLOTY|nr:MBL fold metallo-hydrolase [Clostridium tyrobutyricum]AND85541.1 beta-lactamase superfamily sulfatase [Clostridium tyrobutyricum]ANP70075.1 MBL fold metallo-hydrolase [Clostridium tyrobutyricum]MBV4434419.1 MBL fold metallo-hydrolase [Clostridium tyrobutyricum]QNB65565.1 MBL fold metallo-hydrolase [Clostridium tyrobutyricum]CDL92443.1 Ribonuclease Z [Clostridium tyrobutyricum DIVETGP]